MSEVVVGGSILDRVKSAMGTYEVLYQISPGTEEWGVHRADMEGERIRSCDSESEAESIASDLNARAVVDAIAGALTWEQDGDDILVAKIGTIDIGCITFFPRPVPMWAAELSGNKGLPSRHATEIEARAAVEQAFKAALLEDGGRKL